MEKQPIDNIIWIDVKELTANNYNPNHVAIPELDLLKLSIIEDGWTQPLVISKENEIIDGFHRWFLTCNDTEISNLTDNKVPTVMITPNKAMQMMSTIRHNRARGTHGVVKMAQIVAYLLNETNLEVEDIQIMLGMEWEEIDRLYDTSGMVERGSVEKLNEAWKPLLTDKDRSKLQERNKK
jgi:ParB-like chromosome segregation protein Spo0J